MIHTEKYPEIKNSEVPSELKESQKKQRLLLSKWQVLL